MDALNRTGDNGVRVDASGTHIDTNYTANPLNQYSSVGSQTLTYDAKFNLTSYDGVTFTYNAANHLTGADKAGASRRTQGDGYRSIAPAGDHGMFE